MAKSRRHKLRQAASEESDKKEEQQLHHGLRNWRKLWVSSTLTQLNRAVKNGHNRSPTASKNAVFRCLAPHEAYMFGQVGSLLISFASLLLMEIHSQTY